MLEYYTRKNRERTILQSVSKAFWWPKIVIKELKYNWPVKNGSWRPKKSLGSAPQNRVGRVSGNTTFRPNESCWMSWTMKRSVLKLHKSMVQPYSHNRNKNKRHSVTSCSVTSFRLTSYPRLHSGWDFVISFNSYRFQVYLLKTLPIGYER